MKRLLHLRWELFRRNRDWRRRGFRLSIEKTSVPGYPAYWRYVNHIYVETGAPIRVPLADPIHLEPRGIWVKKLLGAVSHFDSLADAFELARDQAKGIRCEALIASDPNGILSRQRARKLEQAKAQLASYLLAEESRPHVLSVVVEKNGAHLTCKCGWAGSSTDDGHLLQDGCLRCQYVKREAELHLKESSPTPAPYPPEKETNGV